MKKEEHKIIFVLNNSQFFHFATVEIKGENIYFYPTFPVSGYGYNWLLPITITHLNHISWHQSWRIHIAHLLYWKKEHIIITNWVGESTPKNPSLEVSNEIWKRWFHQLLDVYIQNTDLLPLKFDSLSPENDIFLFSIKDKK